MKNYSLLATLVMISLLMMVGFSSCSVSNKSKLKNEITKQAEEINKAFVTLREATEKRAGVIQDAYENMANYDQSIKGMDVSEGGIYKLFEGKIYYPTKDKFNGKGMIATMIQTKNPMYIDDDIEYKPENFAKARFIKVDSPEYLSIKKEIHFWEQIIVKVMDTGEKTGYKEYVYWGNPRRWIHVFGMYFDFISNINLDINQEILNSMAWCKNGTPYGNPEGTPKWTKEAMVDMMGTGWLVNIALPVNVKGKYKGMITANLYPYEFNNKFFKNSKNKLLFLDLKGALVGISKEAKKALAF